MLIDTPEKMIRRKNEIEREKVQNLARLSRQAYKEGRYDRVKSLAAVAQKYGEDLDVGPYDDELAAPEDN